MKKQWIISLLLFAMSLWLMIGSQSLFAADIPSTRVDTCQRLVPRAPITQATTRVPTSSLLQPTRSIRTSRQSSADKISAYDFQDMNLSPSPNTAPPRRSLPQSALLPARFSLEDLQRIRPATSLKSSSDVSTPPARTSLKAAPWTPDHLLADATQMNDGYLDMKASPTTGYLYTVFEATDLGGTDRDIHIARSTDGGANWSVWEMPSSPYDESMPELAIDSAGYLHVVWIRADGYIVRARSQNGDDPETWAWVKGLFTDSINATPSIAVSGAGDFARVFIAAAYQEINWDLYQWEWTLVWQYSTNGGNTTTYDALVPDGYPDLWPDVAINGETVHLINGEADMYTGKPRILMSTDAMTGSFADITDLTFWTSFSSGFPQIVADGNTVVAVFQHDWEDGLGGIDGDIIQFVSWDNGLTINGPHEVVADEYESVGPAIYAHGGVIGYLWLDAPPNVDEFNVAARQGGNNGHPDMFGDVEVVSDLNLAEPQFHFVSGVFDGLKLHAGWIDRRDYPTSGLNVYTSERDVLPNFAPCSPQDWESCLVANMTAGVRETGYLKHMRTAYISFALMNNGLRASSGETRVVIQVNGIPKAEWILADGLPTASYTTIEDYPLLLSAGDHEIRMTIDYLHQVDETSEDDNVASEVWTWIDGLPVLRIEPGEIVHRIDGVSAKSIDLAEALIRNPPLKSFKQLPVIDRRLQDIIGSGQKSARLPVVFSPARRVDTPALDVQLQTLDPRLRRETVMAVMRGHISREKQALQPLLDDLKARGQMDAARELWLPGMLFAEMSPEAIDALAADPSVGWLWLDNTPSRTFGTPAAGSPAADKADPVWHLDAIGAPEAWARGYDGNGVLIGHLDSGVCYDHPDLAAHLWDGGVEWPHHGYDAVDKDNDPYDADTDWRHGTHTAGLIVGDGSGGQATGAAPGAELMVLRVLPGYWNDMIEGMQFALDHGPVDLFTMSGGWSNPANDVKEANRMNADVLLGLDIPWIVATGNGDNIGGHYAPPQDISSPADCPSPWFGDAGHSGVIAVGAINSSFTMWDGSSVGPTVWDITSTTFADYPFPPGLLKPDISAPGQDITSTWYDGGYITYSGTSMACPLGAAAAAILKQAAPEATSAELAEALERSAVDIMAGGRDPNAGAGVIDIPAALDRMPVQQQEIFFIHNDGPLPLNIVTIVWQQSWLSISPTTGSVAPGDSLRCTAVFTPDYLGDGMHVDQMLIIANDQVNLHYIDVALIIGQSSSIGDSPARHQSTLGNYPNPFNPQTEIRFEVPTSGRVQLTVHDLRGRRVRRLIDAEITAGKHTVTWNATDDRDRSLAGGVYLLRLVDAAGRVTSSKVSLVR